ncbi:MAG: SpoIIE family protein phosphatase [Chlorobi bacterium]|nr:SpoIIE family protein phosphatase [Chlorobiota bacterium]
MYIKEIPYHNIRRNRRIFFFTFFLFIFFLPFTDAQHYFFDTYGVEQGLSSSKVYCILQDKRDFVWLGTEGGVSRFDGRSFKDYSSEQGMASSGVFSVLEDSRGNLWFGHLDGGLTRYDGFRFENITFDSVQIKGDITSITETRNHRLWITTTASGAFLISQPFGEPGDMKIKQYKGSEGLSDQVFGSFMTRDSTYYCLTEVGINYYNPEKDRFENFILKGLTHYWTKTCMLEDSKANLWFGTYNGGLYKYDKQLDSIIIYDKRDGLAKNWISCLQEDRDGNIWVGTFGGGITVIRNGKIHNYNTDNGLNDNYIKCIYEDHEGNILIGTQYHGFSIFKGEAFVSLTEKEGLSNPNVWAVYEDYQGKYWFGTNKGITVFNPSAKGDDRFTYFDQQRSSIEDNIRFIREDNNRNLWIGTYGGGVFQYNMERGRFFYDFFLNRNLYRDLVVTALEVDNKDQLWVGTNDGLAYWDIEKNTGTRYTQINGLTGNGITALYFDGQGTLWIGSDRKKGLTRYDIKTGKFEKVPLGREIVPNAIARDKEGNIWMGTTIGAFAWNGDSLYLHLTEEQGLLTNIVNLVASDDHGNIYLGTNKGLNRYVPAEQKMYTYTSKNGFVGIETKKNAVYKDHSGYIWFGTANGVTRYDPAKESIIEQEPLTHILGIQVHYKPRPMVEGMKLNHNERDIIFDYYSVCLTNPDVVSYRIMLEGADADWRPVTKQTRAIYSALSPGKYTFKVIASNSSGQWNSKPVTFGFMIRPPFYQTWWFILTMLILLAVTIILYIKIREQNLIREKKILEEKVAQRTAEVVQKSKELEEKNKDITDSIKYAQRIQKAILPREDSFSDTFILFKPKDIVSGDFYWFHVDNSKMFIAAVDCTGHGVPGAFMSIIGYNSLSKIVKEYHIYEPAAILDQLNEEIFNTLHVQAAEDEVKDGMDMALVVYDVETRKLQYAGAYNPLYLIRKGALTEIKADRFAIGRTSVDIGQKFTNHEIDIEPGDTTYIFSDGYADQFGGPEGKKFKTRQLKQHLIAIQHLTIKEQKTDLEKTIEDWKGDMPQIDDILIIGTSYK